MSLCGSFGLATSRAAGRKLNAFATGTRRRGRRGISRRRTRRSRRWRTRRSRRKRGKRSKRKRSSRMGMTSAASSSSTWRQLAGNRKMARQGKGRRG